MRQDAALFGSAGYQETFDRNTHAWTLKFGLRLNWLARAPSAGN
jgi:hypothetical protein